MLAGRMNERSIKMLFCTECFVEKCVCDAECGLFA